VNVTGSGAGSAAAPAAPTAAGLTDNVVSALCYLPLPLVGLVLAIVFLVLAPYNQNRTIRFHAFQSIFLHVAAIVIYTAWHFIAVFSGFFLFFLTPLIWLGFFVLFLLLMIKAYQNQKLVLPIIGPLAEQQAGS
jgi:uncharacterized membrane protein